MGKVDEAKVPSASKAREAFKRAMEEWDESAADAAAAALARYGGRDECFELFTWYGSRDFRDIGHKAIYVANSFRTLEAIGWQHALLQTHQTCDDLEVVLHPVMQLPQEGIGIRHQ